MRDFEDTEIAVYEIMNMAMSIAQRVTTNVAFAEAMYAAETNEQVQALCAPIVGPTEVYMTTNATTIKCEDESEYVIIY